MDDEAVNVGRSQSATSWYARALLVGFGSLLLAILAALILALNPLLALIPLFMIVFSVWGRRRIERLKSLGRWRLRDELWPLLAMFPPVVVACWLLIGGELARLSVVLFAALAGIALIRAAATGRVGLQRVCAKCDYEQGDPAPLGSTPSNCPECGAEWLQPGGVEVGRRVRSPGAIVAGVLLILGAVGGFVLMLEPAGVSRRLPTSILVERAARQSTSSGVWTELATRPLTPDQVRRIASGILDARRSGVRIQPMTDLWLTYEIEAGTLPEDLVDRYYEEMMIPRLILPQGVRVGVPATVWVAAPVGQMLDRLRPHLFLQTCTVDGDPAKIVWANAAEGGLIAAEGGVPGSPDEAGHHVGTPSTFVATRPGQLRVSARAWVFHHPGWLGSATRITIGDDGRPNFPPGTTRVREVNLEGIITVEPAR